jgi:uncharacterized RDD family membrane protein YckC/ribosomal protein L40E
MLGFTSKAQIEQYGVAKFNAHCRESVFTYLKEWESMTERIGFWLDMEHAYKTLENTYIESCWWALKQLWDKGLIYQGYRVTPHCPRCGTSNLPGSKFCYKCGAQLPEAVLPEKKICRGCHAANPLTAKFCYRCGLKLPEQAAFGAEAVATAGFWRRLAAYFIDGIFINIASDVILSVVLFIVSAMNPAYEQNFSPTDLLLNPETTAIPVWYWYVVLGIIALDIAYWTIAIGWKGRTVGKLMLGIKVVRTDGSRVGYGRAFARFWSYYLCWLTFGIGFLVIAWNSRNRGLHDLICDTMVIKT